MRAPVPAVRIACVRRQSLPVAVGALLALLFAGPVDRVHADGLIYVPHPPGRVLPPGAGDTPSRVRRVRPPRQVHFPLQVSRHHVSVRIDGPLAQTKVEETFHNPGHRPVEGIYLFPMPVGAAVTAFRMKMGGRLVEGEVIERDKARRIYQDIVRQTRDPGLLEYVDRGLFRASVFPIPARGSMDVVIEYSETIATNGGLASYRYPLDTGRFSGGPFRDVLIDVDLRARRPLRTIDSPSHDLSIERIGEQQARLRFRSASLDARQDFSLNWNVGEDVLAPSLLTWRDATRDGSGADLGYFWLGVTPRRDARAAVPPKDVVFVIDTSGSMLGPKMEQVKKALRHCVDGLNAGDRFDIVDFSTEARGFRSELVAADESGRAAALQYVDQLEARGGTNLEEALRLGLGRLRSPERLQMVVLLTDGEPTIGVTTPKDLLASVRSANRDRRRVFVFAVGEDLNAQLLDRLVEAERGAAEYIRDRENIEVRLSRFYDKIDAPVLTDVHIELLGLDAQDVYPRPLPDLFRGDTLQLLGRFRGEGHHAVVVRGTVNGQPKVYEYSLDFGRADDRSRQHEHLAPLWATRKIGYLVEQLRLHGESKELIDEVVRLSKLHGVITPYTSWLILEDSRAVATRPGGGRGDRWPRARGGEDGALGVPRRRWAASDAILGGAEQQSAEVRERLAEGKDAFDADKGKKAVDFSRGLGRLKSGVGAIAGKAASASRRSATRGEAEDAAAESEFLRVSGVAGGQRVRRAAGKTFYLQDKRWVDGSLTTSRGDASGGDAAKPIEVVYLSDAYFALLDRQPGLGAVLALGSEISFEWRGLVYRIIAS